MLLLLPGVASLLGGLFCPVVYVVFVDDLCAVPSILDRLSSTCSLRDIVYVCMCIQKTPAGIIYCDYDYYDYFKVSLRRARSNPYSAHTL